MNNRAIRMLPFPLTSHFTHEIVREIKAIPDEAAVYTEEELKWIKRAVQNLHYMVAHADLSGQSTEANRALKAHYEATLGKYGRTLPT